MKCEGQGGGDRGAVVTGAVAVAALLCGCLVEIDYGGTRFSCEVDGICPGGLECIDMTCVPPRDSQPIETLRLTVIADVLHDPTPVMVALTPERIDYSRAAPGGADIRFIDPFGAEDFAHEIERWDPTGTSIVWVKVPAQGVGDSFDMIYGGGSSDNQRPAEVWSDYQAVYHLDSDGGESRDGLDATAQGGVGFATGMIGGAAAFDGVDDHLTIGAAPLIRATRGATLSLWVRPSVDPSVGAVFEVSNGTGDATRLFINVNDSAPTAGMRTQDGGSPAATVIGPAVIATDTWALVTATFDLATQTGIVYIDGVEVARSDSLEVDLTTPDTDASGAVIGADDGLGNFFAGMVDEIRLAGVAVDAGRVEAEYLSMTDALFDYEPLAAP